MTIYVASEQIGLAGYWITDILSGISKEALKKNITVCDYTGGKITPTQDTPRAIVLAVGYSMHWIDETCREIKENGAEVIVINADQSFFAESMSTAGVVSFGIRNAVYKCMNYLIGVKRSKIAFFGAHVDTCSDDIKAEEFLRLSEFWGLNSDRNDVYRGSTIAECYGLFAPNIENYNAVICSSDAAAYYIIENAKKRGIKVPSSLAVIGFGDSKICETAEPTISSVKTDFVKLGRQAVKLHQLLQKNDDINSAGISVECPLILRNTTPKTSQQKNTAAIAKEIKAPSYATDLDLLDALRAEELLRNRDSIDKEIAIGLYNGKSTTAIADSLFISATSAKYRIKKMLTLTDLKSKSELVELIRKYHLI